MSLFNITTMLSRLSVGTASSVRTISTSTNVVYFRITDSLFGEPLKKRKRADPAMIKQKELKKRKKLEKEIRKLERHAKQLKPCKELEIPDKLITEKEKRLRNVQISNEELDKRILLLKEWSRYKQEQFMQDEETIEKLFYSQRKALNELRAESEELYIEAIQIDPFLLPYKTLGPVITPPIKTYYSPDGEYVDITRKFEGEE